MKILLCFLLTVTMVIPASAVILNPDTSFLQDTLSQLQNRSYQPALDALGTNEFQTATDLAKGYVAQAPADPNAHLLLLLGYIGLQDDAALKKHLGELKQFAPKIYSFVSQEIATYHGKQKRYYLALTYLNNIPPAEQTGKMLRLRGEILEIQGDIKGAIKTYELLVSREPDAPDVLLALTRQYLVEGDAQKSLSYSQRLAQTATNLPAVHVLSGTASMMSADIEAARSSFEKAVALNDKEVMAWNQLGIIELLSANYPAALREFQNANANANYNEANLGIAYAALFSGDANSALTALDNVETRNSLTLLVLAATQMSLGNLPMGNQEYRKDAGIFVDFGVPGFDMGKYAGGDISAMSSLLAFSNDLFRQGYFALTIRLLEENGDLLDKSPFISLTYARSQWKVGNTAAALTTYAKIQKQYPELVAPVVEVADIDFHSGNMDKALSGYQQAVKIQPTSLHLRAQLASLYNHLNRPEEAIKELEIALKAAPDSVYLLDQIASTYLEKLNKPEDALRYAEKALALNAKDLNVKNTLAAIHYSLGHYDQATELYLQLAEMNIGNPVFYYQTAMSMVKSNKREQAVKAFERALDSGPAFAQYPEAEAQYNQLMSAPEN